MTNTNNTSENNRELRLNAAIARSGYCSRRDADKIISDGRVSIAGDVIYNLATKVTSSTKIFIDGVLVNADPIVTKIWRMHKPKGIITTHKDPQQRTTLFDLLPVGFSRVVAVGRLDFNSEGLILITNNGALAGKIASPQVAWKRKYRVRAFGKMPGNMAAELIKGKRINGIYYSSCEINLISQRAGNSWYEVTLTEGKNREIRKIFEYFGLQVNRLIRTSFGPFQLGNLPTGKFEEVPAKVIKEQIPKEWNL